MELLSEKYAHQMHGVLNCYDRIVIAGHLQPLSYAKGMTGYLYREKIRIFDYAKVFAEPLRELVRENAEMIAKTQGVEIEFVSKSRQIRKETRIRQVIEKRGDYPGLVHILSAMEACTAYMPWHDKQSHKTFVKTKQGKCLHYYFYFIDEELGLCYLRVPTWSPFRLQFYCNGHNWLASHLRQHEIGYVQQDNAFLQIDDFEKANELALALDVEHLHAKLDHYAQIYCPVVTQLGLFYSWSLMQIEYATDLVFKEQRTLQAIYPHLLETLIQAVKPADIATFLGRKLHGNFQDELGNRFSERLEGRCIRHRMGAASIKMYDKFEIVLRIETTVSNVSFFSQRRQVHHRDGTTSIKWAPMKKSIYSIPALQEQLLAVNQRYHKFISAIETPDVGVKKLQKLTEIKRVNDRRYKGFHLLTEEDASLFRTLLRGEFVIQGFTNKTLRQHLSHLNAGQATRLLKRLRVHGLVKRVGRRYKYYLTELGRQASTMRVLQNYEKKKGCEGSDFRIALPCGMIKLATKAATRAEAIHGQYTINRSRRRTAASDRIALLVQR